MHPNALVHHDRAEAELEAAGRAACVAAMLAHRQLAELHLDAITAPASVRDGQRADRLAAPGMTYRREHTDHSLWSRTSDEAG